MVNNNGFIIIPANKPWVKTIINKLKVEYAIGGLFFGNSIRETYSLIFVCMRARKKKSRE